MIDAGQCIVGLKVRILGPVINSGRVGVVYGRTRENLGWYEVMFQENEHTIPYSRRELELIR